MNAATRILRFSRSVIDLASTCAFYRDALGFAADEGLPQQMGRCATMTLGDQEIKLVAPQPPLRRQPSDGSAASPGFQHCAIVVRDMDAAYHRLLAHGGSTAISHGGPQLLPPSSGGVTAYKFRDPDGNPLEFIRFPPDHTPEAWRNLDHDDVCVGIDHTAIVVRDQAGSIDFYTRLLGMSVTSRSRNAGAEQQRLDGLDTDVVDVIGLRPAAQATPHLELLAYIEPVPEHGGIALGTNADRVWTRLVLEVGSLPPLLETLRQSGALMLAADSKTAMISDPDGHTIVLVDEAENRKPVRT